MDLRGKHRPCAVKVPACLLIHLPRGQALSWGCLCSCHVCWAWRPEPSPREESGLISMARFSLCVSPSLSAHAGAASSPRNASPLQMILVLWRPPASRPSVLSGFHPRRDPGRRVVAVPVMRSPQLTFPLVSRRSLLHLIGGEALHWSQNCLPQGNPHFIAS